MSLLNIIIVVGSDIAGRAPMPDYYYQLRVFTSLLHPVSAVVAQSSFEAMKADSRSDMTCHVRKEGATPFLRKGIVGMCRVIIVECGAINNNDNNSMKVS